ncbi:MAG: hypothetical protein ACTSYI_11275 [Promethearchaeota archaeon]
MKSIRFKASPRNIDDVTFHDMARKIGSTAQLSPTLIYQYGKLAIDDWEKTSGYKMKNLFLMRDLERSENITNILENFQEKLKPLISCPKVLNKTLSIANVGYQIIFDPLI